MTTSQTEGFEIEKIEFADNRPVRVTVSMPVQALAHLARHYGSIPSHQIPRPLSDLWGVATGTVIFPFWENGVDACIAGDEY